MRTRGVTKKTAPVEDKKKGVVKDATGKKKKMPKEVQMKARKPKKTGERKKAPAKSARNGTNEVETGVTTNIAATPTCVVVYSTGDLEYFKTEAIARKKRSGLPGSMVIEYRNFSTKDEATEFMGGSCRDKKSAAVVTPSKQHIGTSGFGNVDETFTPSHVSPGPATLAAKAPARYGNPNANLPLKALNSIVSTNLERIRCPREGNIVAHGGTAASYLATLKNSGDDDYLAQMKQAATTNVVEIQVHVFKFKFEPQPKYQVVTFELYDLQKKKTYWTHHADKWEQTFQQAKSNGFSALYDDICYQFRSFLMRDVSTPKSGLQNQPWQHEGPPRADGSKYKLDLMGLYALFPFNYSTEEIKTEVRLLGSNALKPVAKEAYEICHNTNNKYLRESLNSDGTGTYWKMLESAFQNQVKVIEEDSLDCMFLDEEIYKFMGLLFNEHGHPKDYANSNLINFAYGRITANDLLH
jgi:hypothetical protein